MNDMMRVGIDAAKEAGDFLMRNFGKVGEIAVKGDRDLATNLDKEAERMITDKIRAHFPSHAIIAEESGVRGDLAQYLWIIDPLDGTHNYIRDVAVFGVSIGILREDEFVGGIIYMAADKELYVGEKGSGAYKNGGRISVSGKNSLKDCSLSFDSCIRYSPDIMLRTLGDLAAEVFNVRMFGSSARALSYLAEGKLDASVEFYDQPWDFAGGVCIIEEAGGILSGLKGETLSYQSRGYIASNAILHEKIQSIVSRNYTKALDR